jgi:hypothetical protein
MYHNPQQTAGGKKACFNGSFERRATEQEEFFEKILDI